ncbi:MAG TPA: hypothetical protein VMV18_05925, partial [bacterium]|nr:hypothetical protein [bacterium]
MKTTLVALFLAALPLAAGTAFAAEPDVDAAVVSVKAHGPEAENASLRRTLASVLVLKRLNLTAQQKTELTSIIADAKALRAKTKADVGAAVPAEQRTQILEKA